jgi:hypothetical protein
MPASAKLGPIFQGGLQTRAALDVAIDGEGFFKVRKERKPSKPRSGHFMTIKTAFSKPARGQCPGCRIEPCVRHHLGKDSLLPKPVTLDQRGVAGLQLGVFTVPERSK